MPTKKSQVKEPAKKSLEICPGLVIDTKLKIGAVLRLEQKYGKPIQQIDLQTGRITDIVNFIIALAIQHNSELAEGDVLKLIGQMDIEQIGKIEKIFNIEE